MMHKEILLCCCLAFILHVTRAGEVKNKTLTEANRTKSKDILFVPPKKSEKKSTK